MNKPLKVGITGGIGSGKSVVCRVLEAMGYPVYYSDQRAKELMESDPVVGEQLIEAFGPQTFEKGALNRRYLADRIFADETLREKINGIVHPAVRNDFKQWAEKASEAVVFQESALLFETGAYKSFDRTVLVTAPAEERIQRVMKRDNISEKEVLGRVESQLPDEAKIPLADFVIENGKESMVLIQLNEMLEKLLSKL